MILDNRQRFRKQVPFGDQAKRCGCFCAASCRKPAHCIKHQFASQNNKALHGKKCLQWQEKL